MFHLVSKPAETGAQVVISGAANGLSPQRDLYRRFWAKYLETVHSNHPSITNVRSPATRTFTHINYLRKGVTIVLGFVVPQSKVLAEIYIDLKSKSKNLDVLLTLKSMQKEIEKEVGCSLIWDEIPGKRACRIRALHDGRIDDESKHVETIQWLMNAHVAMKKAFRPRVDSLPSEIWDREESEMEDEEEDTE